MSRVGSCSTTFTFYTHISVKFFRVNECQIIARRERRVRGETIKSLRPLRSLRDLNFN